MGKSQDNDTGWLFDFGGASALAGAAGFAVFNLAPPDYLPFGAAVAASVVLFATHTVLRRIGAEPADLPLTAFASPDINPEPEPDAMLLGDVLASMGPDSRVVRMFAPDQMPTAGQLQARIERHAGGARDDDAADALHQALAEIRKALR